MLFNLFESKDRERISSVDTAWLRMDSPTNLMMITGVMTFEARVDINQIKKLIRERFLAFKRFRQRPVHTSSGWYWETDEQFDLDLHVRRIALPEPAGQNELQQFAGEMISTPLDTSKPLWQFHLIDNFNGGSALVMRVHHCYADGIALVAVVMSMTEGDPKISPLPVSGAKRRRRVKFYRRMVEPAARLMDKSMKLGMRVSGEGMNLVRHPMLAVNSTKAGLDMAAELAKVTALPADSKTRFKGKLSVSKRCAWAEPLSLAEVKKVSKSLGCSINDVLLSCVAGSLRRYLVELGDSVEGLEIRGSIPVNLRPLERAGELGNKFGLVFLTLPIGIANPIERVYDIKRRMAEIKNSAQAEVSLGVLGLLGRGPESVQNSLLNMFSKKATAVMTNVPGPQEPVYFAGHPIKEQMFWVPQSGSVGMGVSILSYNGQVQFGLVTDSNLVAEPEEVIRYFDKEFERLLVTALLQPWDQQRESLQHFAPQALAAPNAESVETPVVAAAAES